MTASDPQDTPRSAVADAAGEIWSSVSAAAEALLAIVVGWLGWDAPDDDRPGRAEAPVMLRAIPGGAGAQARRTESGRPGRDEPRAPAHGAVTTPPGAGAAFEERDAVTVLVRDPRAVFVFWTLQPETAQRREAARASARDEVARDALQVEVERDLDAPEAAAPSTWIVPLPPRATTAHVDLMRPRRRVRVTLGVFAEELGFVPLVRCAAIDLPEASPASLAPPRWRRVGRGADGEPPETPSPEASDLLAARAAECETATSSMVPLGHHLLERDAGAVTAPS